MNTERSTVRTETFYRRANVSRQDALAGLLARFPEADLLSFKKVEKDGHEVFAAQLRLAEFPPKKKEEGEESEEPKDEAPPEPSDEGDEAPAEDGGDEGESKPPFGGDGDGDADDMAPGEEGEHHKPKATLDEVVNLLHQVLHTIAPGPDVAPGGPGVGPGSLMDVGAPGQGDMMPPPPEMEGAPLPPPVKHPKDQVGAPAFAHADPQWKKHRSFDTIRDDAHEVTNKQLIEEAHQVFAGYRVAKIDRRQMAEQNRVLVAMVKSTP